MTEPGRIDQGDLDDAVVAFYTDADEDSRIQGSSTSGLVEFTRVQRLLRARLEPGSRVLDVGGATGVHSRWLAADGHRVTLIDPVPQQVERAAGIGTFEALVGDARRLPFDDGCADAVLLFGPLYHLAERQDRLGALTEAVRVLRPGGLLFAQGISRLAALSTEAVSVGYGQLDTALWELLRTGRWASTAGGFPGGHFHTVAELRDEVAEAGCVVESVHGLEGPHAGALDLLAADEQVAEAALELAERLEQRVMGSRLGDAVAEYSPHVMVVARRVID